MGPAQSGREAQEEAPAVAEKKKSKKADKKADKKLETKAEKKAAKKAEKKKKKRKRSDEEEEEEEEEDEPRDESSRRALASQAAEDWMKKNAASPVAAKAQKREPGKPFSRVDDSEWIGKIQGSKLTDNSYEGTYGSNGYGAKASLKLQTVTGKNFRHEKTKKKRGNYRGGTIDLGTNSIKFEE